VTGDNIIKLCLTFIYGLCIIATIVFGWNVPLIVKICDAFFPFMLLFQKDFTTFLYQMIGTKVVIISNGDILLYGPELVDWLKENNIRFYNMFLYSTSSIREHRFTCYFLSKKSAMHFKMVWN